ncbi:hypothetical protein [Coleofasciculus sp.]|uniref:hypothetical protein n=1 Tax=Coleofasciculus sp. TaxID=3100458 RepID=UPI0039F8CABC
MRGLGVRSLLVLPQLWGSRLRGGWCDRAVGISEHPGIRRETFGLSKIPQLFAFDLRRL